MRKSLVPNYALLICLILINVGIICPWKCAGDISWICTSGIQISLNGFRIVKSTETIVLTIIVFLMCLVLFSIGSIKKYRFDLISLLLLFAVAILGFKYKIIIDHGGIPLFIFTNMIYWVNTRLNISAKYKMNVTMLFSTINIILIIKEIVVVYQSKLIEGSVIGATEIRSGLFLCLIGSILLIMLILISGVGIKEKTSDMQTLQ
jgi:hypothetical protein